MNKLCFFICHGKTDVGGKHHMEKKCEPPTKPHEIRGYLCILGVLIIIVCENKIWVFWEREREGEAQSSSTHIQKLQRTITWLVETTPTLPNNNISPSPSTENWDLLLFIIFHSLDNRKVEEHWRHFLRGGFVIRCCMQDCDVISLLHCSS